MNILLVSAHPDDMEIGMGGTAAKLADDGASLTSLVLTDGRRSANPFSLSAEALAGMRQAEARKACAILGISDVRFFNLPDLKSDHNFQAATNQLIEILSEMRPDEIYMLHPELDRHSSHQLSGRVVVDAIHKLALKQIPVWAYEVWGLFNRWDRFEDISAVISKKIQAISEHKSQVACVPYAEGVIGLNRWRAVFADPQQESTSAAFAEVFIRMPQES